MVLAHLLPHFFLIKQVFTIVFTNQRINWGILNGAGYLSVVRLYVSLAVLDWEQNFVFSAPQFIMLKSFRFAVTQLLHSNLMATAPRFMSSHVTSSFRVLQRLNLLTLLFCNLTALSTSPTISRTDRTWQIFIILFRSIYSIRHAQSEQRSHHRDY